MGPGCVLPEPTDNVAISVRRHEAGEVLELPDSAGGADVTVRNTLLEGHRVVVRDIAAGEPLLSWSTPFATAVTDLHPGDVVCTEQSLQLLRARDIEGLPDQPTAQNVALDPYTLDEAGVHVTDPVPPVPDGEARSFEGYRRPAGPAGIRNHIALIALTSRSSGFVTELARRINEDPTAARTDTFDGVVPVAHTEGGAQHTPNNAEFLLRTIAGMTLHPNLGAVLLVGTADDVVSVEQLRTWMREHDYPEPAVPHAFVVREGGFDADVAACADTVRAWLPEVSGQHRVEVPLSELSVGLQCGGSDAFSGITANPLVGSVSHELVRHGAKPVLAETDELIGAEPYVLDSVASLDVARALLDRMARFKERVGWHGHTAEGNPSGGNVFRGLYNIVLKSVGAARKLDRRTRLDHVIDYAGRLPDGPGYVFMDSPGNDLESVAGQVGSGCQLIFFTTGNGSITNFPFVPTLKFVTTTGRYELLSHEMDVDAGRYLTGTPMEQLTDEVVDLVCATSSGRPTAGERAGHSQTSIWRDWRQTGPVVGVSIRTDGRQTRPAAELPAEYRDSALPGVGVPVLDAVGAVLPHAPEADLSLLADGNRRATDQVALILPTSLCAAQISLRIADLAERERWFGDAVTQVTALPHTEGCGVSSGSAEQTYARTMLGYLTHPRTRYALLLEHGCEKTHNDYFHNALRDAGVDPERFGWASIQLDGGIAAVTDKVRDWAVGTVDGAEAPRPVAGGLADLTVGLDARGSLDDDTATALALVGSWITAAGGTVLIGAGGALAESVAFRAAAFGDDAILDPTLAHAQRADKPGWQVMRMPTTDWMETVTGLGAGGAELVIASAVGGSLSSHRFVPVVQFSADPDTARRHADDLDATVAGGSGEQAEAVFRVLLDVASRRRRSRASAAGDVGFQITRGLLGTSM